MDALARFLRRLSPWHRGYGSGLRFGLALGDDAFQAGYLQGLADGRDDLRRTSAAHTRRIARKARDFGARVARRELLEVVGELAPRVGEQAALAWLDGLEDAFAELGEEWPEEPSEIDPGLVSASSRIRTEVAEIFLARFAHELGRRALAREMVRAARRPRLEDALRYR